MSKPYVSIIIPCYNLGEFLPAAVESAQRQTLPPAEVLVVNDGSTDDHTLRVLRDVERSGATVLHTTNNGAPAARNHGITRAQGDYILCLDADDMLLPEHLENTVPVLDTQQDVGIVAPAVEMFGDIEGVWTPPDYDPVKLLWRNCIPSASLFRRVCWRDSGGYPDLRGGQDWAFWISIVTRGWRWAVVPQVLYRYRRRAGSISERREADRQGTFRALFALHAGKYREHCADICVQMDEELNALRNQLGRYRHDAQARTQRIAALEATLRRAQVLEPTSVAAPVDETPEIAGRRRVLERAERRLARLQKALERAEAAERVRMLVRAHVPSDAQVLVVSRGDDELLKQGPRTASHFPRLPDGRYAGHYPADSEAAIGQIEEQRSLGATHIVFPATSEWWLDHYDGMRDYLESHYCRIAARPGVGVIYSLRPAHRTFSVVVCTHNRSALLALALDSLFVQDYPRDAYEIIVIDNASTDDTADVVRAATMRSPVRLSYHVEPRNGLSYARNLGVEVARNEFVAFLDDDATAVPGWLSAFNDVINQHHALVVGGRVDLRFDEDFTAPPWFDFPYVRGFFGINYRNRGRTDEVFRIKAPDYIGGGNSAYARRLFTHFGGYDPQLGRNHKTLLAAEETYLNRVLERHDIPIYYTDAAIIHHYIDGHRLSRKHIVRKAYWSGVSNAILGTLLDDPPAPARKSRVHELRNLVRTIAKAPRSPEVFGRSCRIIYNLSFLVKSFQIGVAKRVLRRTYSSARTITWNEANWIAEIEQWPESRQKARQLYHLHLALGNADAAQAQLEHLKEATSATDQRARLELDQLWGPLRRLKYEQMIRSFRAAVEAATPEQARVLVVSRGDAELLQIGPRTARHFPCLSDGTYAGYHPADSATAIEHLETLRNEGADFLVFPATATWWLDHYAALREHLDTHYQRIALPGEAGVGYAIRQKRMPVVVAPPSMGRSAARTVKPEMVM